MLVYCKLVRAVSSAARDCASWPTAWSTAAREERAVATALSRSVAEMSCCTNTSSARLAWRSASSAVTVNRVTLARAAVTLASAETTAAPNSEGSILAINCPFFTGELKSANSSWMRPETWLPTSTVTTACRLPEVLTRETTLPTSAVTVWYSGAPSLPAVHR